MNPYETIDATYLRGQVIPAGQVDASDPTTMAQQQPQSPVLTPQQQRVYSAMLIANVVGFGIGAFLGYRFISKRM